MKTVLLFLGVVVLACASVDARRRARDSNNDDDDDVGHRGYRGVGMDNWRKNRYESRRGMETDGTVEDGRLDRHEGHRRWGGARGDGGEWRDRFHAGQRGAHHHRGGRYDKFWRNCTCRSQCEGNTGDKLIGCFTNRTSYIRCKDATCSIELCPVNQLFNYTSRSCESCPPGFHVDDKKRHCICNEGTTFDFRSRTCGPCPTGSVVTADKCYCSSNSVMDRKNNACRDCPEGTTKNRHGCQCSNRQEFWSWDSFSCLACPGEWVRRSEGSRRRQRTVEVCECQGEKEIFNKWSVSCIRCPDDSIVATKWGKSFCDCTEIGKRYDWKTNTCINTSADDVDDDNDDDDEAAPPAEP